MTELPIACEKCAPYGGAWMLTDAGMARCDCPRGRELRRRAKLRDSPPLSVEHILTDSEKKAFVEMLASIPFFPPEAGARIAIENDLGDMCRDAGEAAWLVGRIRSLYARWPGPREMRLVYCSKLQPLDGKMSDAISEYYPNGIPSERPDRQLQIEAPALKEIRCGDAQIASAIHAAVEQTFTPRMSEVVVAKLSRAERIREAEFNRVLEDIVTPPPDRKPARPVRQPPLPQWLQEARAPELYNEARIPQEEGTYKRLTQADFDAAVVEVRAERAKEKEPEL